MKMMFKKIINIVCILPDLIVIFGF